MCPRIIQIILYPVSGLTMTPFVFKTGPTPLRCYGGGSFYVYLRNTFLSFGFPNLSMFMSLLPQTRESEVIYNNTYLNPFFFFYSHTDTNIDFPQED